MSFLLTVLCLAAPLCAGEETSTDIVPNDAEPPTWYFFLGGVNAYPKMESEEPIDNIFNPLMKLIAPGFDDVKTVGDLRDDHLIWNPLIGMGRDIGKKWTLFTQLGYNGGTVRTKGDDRSIFLLVLHTDFEIKRTALYGGIGFDYYPFGRVEMRKYAGWRERLRATRPSMGLRGMVTYATYDAKVKVGLGPFPNLAYEPSDSWIIPSLHPALTVDVPINRDDAFSVKVDYSFFADQKDDFTAWTFTFSWKHYFR